MPSGDSAAVDGLILDYLLHHCISALLQEWDARHSLNDEGGGYSRGALAEAAQNADRSLLLVNCMLSYPCFLISLLSSHFFSPPFVDACYFVKK